MSARARKRSVLFAIVALVSLALTACAPAVHPILTSPPKVHITAIPPIPSPTPTPTAAVSGPPELVGTSCAQLGTPTLLSNLFASPKVAVQPFIDIEDNDQPNLNLASTVYRQLGGLACAWGDSPHLYTAARVVTLEVVPNAEDAFYAAQNALLKTDDGHNGVTKNEPVYGDQDYIDCATQSGECVFDIQAGNYWIHIDEFRTEYSGALYPEDAAQTAFVSSVVKIIRALPAAAAPWTAPASIAKLPANCAGELTAADVIAAMGAGANTTAKIGSAATAFDTAMWSSAHFNECYWKGPKVNNISTELEVDILPGSAWAWSTMSPPASTPADSLVPLSGIGDAAIGGCNSLQMQCSVYVEVDASWFDVNLESPKATLATAETVAQDIVTAAS
ncbi:MAG TPA: hypothetical protein VHX87_04495 [Galbitalea sp.]|nr:hypothetical protein [Galbitalea sp.]